MPTERPTSLRPQIAATAALLAFGLALDAGHIVGAALVFPAPAGTRLRPPPMRCGTTA